MLNNSIKINIADVFSFFNTNVKNFATLDQFLGEKNNE